MHRWGRPVPIASARVSRSIAPAHRNVRWSPPAAPIGTGSAHVAASHLPGHSGRGSAPGGSSCRDDRHRGTPRMIQTPVPIGQYTSFSSAQYTVSATLCGQTGKPPQGRINRSIRRRSPSGCPQPDASLVQRAHLVGQIPPADKAHLRPQERSSQRRPR